MQDDNKALINRKTQDLETAIQFMQPIHALMDKYYEMYRNRWSESCEFKISDLYAYTETVVPILTNNRVRGSVHSDYPEYVRHAEGLGDILDHTYDINNWDYESQEIARMGEIYRSAIAYTGYDTDYKNGTGRICVKGINIRWCYLDPAASKFEESSFFFYVEPKRKSQVIKMYPNKKQEIEQSIGKRETGMNAKDNKSRRWFQSLYNSVKNFLNINRDNFTATQYSLYDNMQEMDEEEKRKNSIAFIHYWYRDDEDKWRVSYWADDVLLEDIPNPFWHECLPYDIYNPTKDILSSMGIPMAEHIENLNWEKNVLMGEIIRNVKRQNDPPSLLNSAFGNIQDPKQLDEKKNGRGPIIVNNPDMVPLNAIYDQVAVPAVSSGAFTLNETIDALIDKATGTNDTMRGLGDATSGKEVQLKQEAAYTRIKTKVDNFELFNKKIAEKIIVNAMQFYDKTRGFRIKGDYTKYQDINQDETPFQVEPIQRGMNQDTKEPIYDRTEFFMFANPNEWTKLDPMEELSGLQYEEYDDDEAEGEETQGQEATKKETDKAYKILQMTVEIEAGSSLPVSRMARREEAMELFTAQAIDQQALLEAFDWKDRDEVIKRMQEAAQQQQEAQMQMQQQQLQQQQQAEQARMQQEMQMKQMEMQHQSQLAQMNNQAKTEQAQAKDSGQQQDIASQLDEIRKEYPQAKDMSDEELIAALTGQGDNQDLAGLLDQIRQENPEAAQLSDDELIQTLAQ